MSMKPVWAKPEPGFDPNDNQAVLNYNASAQAHPLSARGLRAPPLEQRLQDEFNNYKKLHNVEPSPEEKEQMKKALYNNSGWLQGLKVDVAGETTVPIREFNRLYEENEATVEWVSRYRAGTEATFRARLEESNDIIKALEKELDVKKSLEEQIGDWKAKRDNKETDWATCTVEINSLTNKLGVISTREKFHEEEREKLVAQIEHLNTRLQKNQTDLYLLHQRQVVPLNAEVEKLKTTLEQNQSELDKAKKDTEVSNAEIERLNTILKKNQSELDKAKKDTEVYNEAFAQSIIVDLDKSRDQKELVDAELEQVTEKYISLNIKYEDIHKNFQVLMEDNTRLTEVLCDLEDEKEAWEKLRKEYEELLKKKDCDELRKDYEKLLVEVKRLRNNSTTGGKELRAGSVNNSGGGSQQGGSEQQRQEGHYTASGGDDVNKTLIELRGEIRDLETRLANANQVRDIYDNLWAKGSNAVPNDHPATHNPVPVDLNSNEKIEHLQKRLYVLVADHVNQGKNQRWYEEKVKLLEENLQKAKRGESFTTEVSVAMSEDDGDSSGDRFSYKKIERIIKQYETGERGWIPGEPMTAEMSKKVRELCLGHLQPRKPLFDGVYTRDDVAFWLNRIKTLEDESAEKRKKHHDQGLVLHAMDQDNTGLRLEIEELKAALAATPFRSSTYTNSSTQVQTPGTTAGFGSSFTNITSDNANDVNSGGDATTVSKRSRVYHSIRGAMSRTITTKKPHDDSDNRVQESVPPISHDN